LDIALSTSWLPYLNLALDDFFRVMELFGVTRFELNYRVHPLNLRLWQRLMDKHQLQITSLHNICSVDEAELAPDNHYGDNLAHLDEVTRQQSVGHLRRTAEAALALGAEAIVVHAGSHAGHYRHPEYSALLEGIRRDPTEDGLKAIRQRVATLAAERNATVEPHLEQLVKSLREVVFDFPTVRFGLENRYHYYGLPNIGELELVLQVVSAENVGLWADLGHGQVQENLGLIPRHELWFERYTDRLVGIHLHGLRGVANDHYTPTADNMDWGMVRRHIGPDTLLVTELSAQANPLGDVIAGMRYLDSFLNGR
jgi:sugar phosphate isomerase/epimerase